MDILTKPLSSFSFADIQAFAQKGKPEGVELDYKKDFQSDEKTSQLVAAFANTRGGVIIVGIAEDRGTGIPISWDGISNGRHDEHVAQVMANISPIPAYEVHTTDESNAKVFVLIRVFEGHETPYYPHNENNLWVRTGSVKKSINIASPEHVELLFKKAERASMGRLQNSECAKRNYQTFLKNAEKIRLEDIQKEKQNYLLRKSQIEDGDRMPPFVSNIEQESVGSKVTMLTVVLQPYFPHEEFVKPRGTEPIIQESKATNSFYSFPIHDMWHSMPEGMIHFNSQGDLICQQVFSNGLVYSSHNIQRQTPNGPSTHIGWFTGELFVILQGTKNILEKMGYQGTVLGKMSVTGSRNLNVVPIVTRMFPDENNKAAFDSYEWSIKIDTNTLADEDKVRDYVTDITKDIHWSFGHKDVVPKITKEYLVSSRYL